MKRIFIVLIYLLALMQAEATPDIIGYYKITEVVTPSKNNQYITRGFTIAHVEGNTYSIRIHEEHKTTKAPRTAKFVTGTLKGNILIIDVPVDYQSSLIEFQIPTAVIYQDGEILQRAHKQ